VRVVTLLRWELAGTIRGMATFASLTVVALASAVIVAAGIATFSLWAPFSAITPTFPGRTDPTNAPTLLPIIGEFRGGVAFYLILLWVVLVAAVLAPALTAGVLVRDRRSGRLDRLLTDTARADTLAAVKWLTALIPLGLILLAAAPAVSFAWLVGGLSGREALESIVVVAGTGCILAAISLLCSAVARTEVVAMLVSYVVVGGFLLGPFALGFVLAVVGLRSVASVAIGFTPIVAVLSAQGAFADKLVKLLPADWPSPPAALAIGSSSAPVWQVDVISYFLLTLILIWVTAIVLEPLHPLKTWRLRTAAGGGQ
jgi:ABC-type transport system involved in multi-copper enzyme maturation permease subunit